jgi:hypothetical protein
LHDSRAVAARLHSVRGLVIVAAIAACLPVRKIALITPAAVLRSD